MISSFMFACTIFASKKEYTLRDNAPWFSSILEKYDIPPIYAPTPENVFHELKQIYEKAKDAEYIGENVSQLDHALQTANHAFSCLYDPNSYEVKITNEHVIAALFHDIGHLFDDPIKTDMDMYGVVDHEKIGALLLLTRGFSNKITTMIAGHVDAKRYLIFKDPTYAAKLSEASKKTLVFQGGAMTPEEATDFEKNPFYKDILFIRQCDEIAKEVSAPTVPFDFYKAMTIDHLKKQQEKK